MPHADPPARPPVWRSRLLSAEAACWLLIFRVCLKLLPFRLIARRLGPLRPPTPAPSPQPLPATARAVGNAVQRAAGRLPVDMVCLPQALAAHAMLRRRGLSPLLHLSARPGRTEGMMAHAWVSFSGGIVIGGGCPADQIELGRFG
jgi:hypothetical protein